MNPKANAVDSVSENMTTSGEPQDGWASRALHSVYGTAAELGSNQYVQAAVTIGVVAGGTALYMGRSKILGAAEELLPSANRLLPESAREGVQNLFAPAVVRAEVAQTPVLLLNEQRTINALSGLGRSKDWASIDTARSFSAELVDESIAARPKLPPGVDYDLANLTEHHGAQGAKWFTENARLKEQAAKLSTDAAATGLRGPLLDKTMSNLTGRLGLPWKGVTEAPSGSLMDAAYSLGQGDLIVSPSLLKSEFSFIGNIVTHEGTHLEQDHLIISRIADRLMIGKVATPEQLQMLSAEHQAAFGKAPDLEHLQRVLLARDGHMLSAGASRRADELEDSFRSLAENNATHYRTEQRALTLKEMRSGFATKQGVEILNDAITAAPDNYFYRTILGEPVFRGLLGQLPRDSSGLVRPLNFQSSSALDMHLFKIVDATYQEAEAARKANLLVYKSWTHEQEASSVGNYFESRLKSPDR